MQIIKCSNDLEPVMMVVNSCRGGFRKLHLFKQRALWLRLSKNSLWLTKLWVILHLEIDLSLKVHLILIKRLHNICILCYTGIVSPLPFNLILFNPVTTPFCERGGVMRSDLCWRSVHNGRLRSQSWLTESLNIKALNILRLFMKTLLFGMWGARTNWCLAH